MSSPYYAPPIDKPGPIYGPNYGPPPQFQQPGPSFPQPYPQAQQPYYNYQAQPQAQCQPQVVYVQQPAPKPPNNSGGGGGGSCCLPCALFVPSQNSIPK
ncbi:hypothetical protein Agabi119p4_8285 [Agaricus bisporus var. burnettii]|uniref:Uncharacterized protein n=1 Tax=Agaricus bisporus var. burnettii TaxID=192524 RepID=A0A8H7C7N3_AGABI|nr:hypothetical protein Agabi119p4_8285 [Agaricus bisporus var. burnettii]